MFYGWLTWLSPYYEGHGFAPERAGLLLAVWSIAQIPAALLRAGAGRAAPALAVLDRPHARCAGSSGTLGALLVPLPPVVGPWVWAALMGVGVGAGFPLGL